MKSLRIALTLILCVSLSTLPNSMASTTPRQDKLYTAETQAQVDNLFCSLKQEKEKVRHTSGPEIANRVKELKRTNKKVRNALAAFERNEKTNHRPRIDDATSVSWDYTKRSGSVSFLKTSFAPAQTFIEGTIEVIMIPTYSADGEWQGTLLTYNYDSQGNFLSEYISDVMLLPDPTYAYWDAILEVEYSWEGTFIQHGTIDLYNQMGTPQGGWPATSRAARTPKFEKASFPQIRGGPRIGIPATPRMKRAMKCTALGCTGTAAGCGVASFFFAGVPFPPCLVGGCVTSATICVLAEVFP